MFRIAICDDEKDMCNTIEKTILTAARERGLTVDTDIFYSGESLVNYLNQENRFDLLFLDIEMGKMNGIDVSEKVRKELGDIDTEIIYVTCTTIYDRKLFDYHPLAFIEKPPKESQLNRALDLALKKRNIRNPYFLFTYNRQTQTVPYHEILYFESDDRKIKIITNATIYSYYGKLSDIKESLPSFFCQIHRSYIINLHQIAQYGGREITMNDGQKISISRNYKEAFLNCQLSEL